MNNEIKKALYREKPIAYKSSYEISKKGIIYHYVTFLDDGTKVKFQIPENDRPESLGKEEPAQLLIRWLVTKDKEVDGE